MLMTGIISCKKTNSDVLMESSITGKWELRTSICGWSGSTNFPAGNGTTISFNSNGQYTATGNRIDNGVYRLSTRTNGQGQVENILFLGGNWNQELRFSISGNTLKLNENAFIYDGCEYDYQKLP